MPDRHVRPFVETVVDPQSRAALGVPRAAPVTDVLNMCVVSGRETCDIGLEQTPVRPSGRDTDWHVLIATRANVLITGSADAVAESIAELMPYLDSPVCAWTPGRWLPTPADAKALLVYDVDALSPQQQRGLSRWLAQAAIAPLRVVSTAGAPLFERVAAGLFLDELYYPLNVVMWEL
jgi:hypothetical protein